MLISILAISLGASLGALLRWFLGTSLNSLFPSIPPGTLVANCIGGYLIGIALSVFAQHPQLAPEWRLFVITGFMGALTTFSTFSAEVTTQIQQGRIDMASLAIIIHVGGSLILTLAGMATVTVLNKI